MRLTPHYMFLQFTNVCNSRCITCHLWAQPPQTIPLDVIKRLDRFIDPARLVEIFYSGGETFVVPECVDIATWLTEWKPGIVLTSSTNGLDPDLYLPRIAEMKRRGIDIRCIVSLNGRPETHDKSRGVAGSYDQALRMIAGLREIGAYATCNLLMIPGLTTQADIDHATDVALANGRGLYKSHLLRHNQWFGEKDDGATIPPFDCHAGDVLCVKPSGDLTACQEHRDWLVFCNLRDESLDEAAALDILARIKRRECQPCGCCTWAYTHGKRCLT